jgi:hypothetical protein
VCKNFVQCVNAASRKCEYGVLEITRDTKVLLNHESKTDVGQIKSMYSHVSTLTFVNTCEYIDFC